MMIIMNTRLLRGKSGDDTYHYMNTSYAPQIDNDDNGDDDDDDDDDDHEEDDSIVIIRAITSIINILCISSSAWITIIVASVALQVVSNVPFDFYIRSKEGMTTMTMRKMRKSVIVASNGDDDDNDHEEDDEEYHRMTAVMMTRMEDHSNHSRHHKYHCNILCISSSAWITIIVASVALQVVSNAPFDFYLRSKERMTTNLTVTMMIMTMRKMMKSIIV